MTIITPPEVSVIVLNYNGRSWLERCLSALAAQTGPPIEVILVDNGSSDDSVAFARSRFPWVRTVALDHNVGFAGGNNVGAHEARATLLAFLNNDTEVDAGWVGCLKAALDARPEAGLATSRVVYLHDPDVIDSAGDGYVRSGGGFKRGHGQSAHRFADATEVFGACGAACMIRRDLFEQLGGFDEDFFLVYEDVDLSYRAQLLDYRVLYVPGAVVRHAGSATMGTAGRVSVFHGQRNLEWVYLKNTPWPLLWRSLPAHVAYAVAGGAYLAASGHLGTWCAAKWSALRGVPLMLRKRRRIQSSRTTDVGRLRRLMERGWFGLKWREKRFDLGRARSR
jgi:GT2 family glycosyltransferase